MMMKLLICAALLAACASTSESSREGHAMTTAAREYFETDVYPILLHKCGACHMETSTSPEGTTSIAYAFLTADGTRAYDLMLMSGVAGDFSVNAPLVTLLQPAHRFDY